MHTNPIQIYSQRKQDEEKFVYIHTDPENVTQNRMKKKNWKRKKIDEKLLMKNTKFSIFDVHFIRLTYLLYSTDYRLPTISNLNVIVWIYRTETSCMWVEARASTLTKAVDEPRHIEGKKKVWNLSFMCIHSTNSPLKTWHEVGCFELNWNTTTR